jgi:hypothetical protein
MIFTNTYVFTRMMFGASLTNNNVAGNGSLTAKYFYAKSFTVGFPSVLGTTGSFFMCHG